MKLERMRLGWPVISSRSTRPGRPERALDLMIDIRDTANAVGGSHAQRDVIDLTLIAAAARANDRSLARALVDERAARKPTASAAAERPLAVNST